MELISEKKQSVLYYVIPSLGMLCFIFYPLCVLIHPDAMIKDPGIGWHLVSGQYMLENRVIIDHDIFSFTKPGQNWTTFEWLFQCFAAGLVKIGGMPLFTAVCALLYGSLPILLYRRMKKEGSNIYISLALSLISCFAFLGHCHARPHLFTYFFFIIFLERLFSYEQGRISSYSLFLFIPLMIPWANLHGGFAAGLATAGLAFLTSLCRYIYSKDPQYLKKTKTFFLFGFGLTLASMVNPHGWHLHQFILKCLSLESIHKMAEFVSPNFNDGSIGISIFTFFLLIFIGLLARRKNKITLLELVLVLFFMYQSLHAVRHIFLFFILIIPICAREFTNMIKTGSWFSKRSNLVAAEQAQIKSDTLWILIICAAFISLSLVAPDIFKNDLYGKNLSPGAGMFVKANMDKFKRPFNTVNIGGALIYHFWPDLKVFGDDRNDFYKDEFYLNEYMEVLSVRPDWERVLDKYEINSAIIADKRLSTLMKASETWDLVYEDEKNYIFLRSHTKNGFKDEQGS